jgi:hypothetical protein
MWRIVSTDEGCLFFDYGYFKTFAEARSFQLKMNRSIRWEGRCTPGKLINGPGTLLAVGNRMFMEGKPGLSYDWWTGTMVNGQWEGMLGQRDDYGERGKHVYPPYHTSGGCSDKARAGSYCNPSPPPPPELIE